jgi:predicted transposase/invertase (TIGR01784 family)
LPDGGFDFRGRGDAGGLVDGGAADFNPIGLGGGGLAKDNIVQLHESYLIPFMRRDSIFYRLFRQSPRLLFDLLDTPPTDVANYRFESIGVKETRFEMDGVFLPPDTSPPGTIFFCEVQFQRDDELYERLFAELFLYLRQNRQRFRDWQAVTIYPSRRIEQTEIAPYQDLLEGRRVHRVYLNELGDVAQLPLGIALMVLTTIGEQQAPEAARLLLNRAQTEMSAPENRGIIEMITTIMVYKFTQLSRQEIEQMLGTTLQETQVYQEAKAEGRQEGEQIGEQRGIAVGEQRGAQREAVALCLRQLARRLRLDSLSDAFHTQVEQLSLPQLEALSEALLDFQTLADLETWLQNN